MATKVIKLQDNNSNTLIPVTDASVIQIAVDGQVKSVKEVILENEKVVAASYNELNDRVETIEAKPGLDTAGTITDVKVNNATVVNNGVAYISTAANDTLGVVALGYTDVNNGYALKVDSNGKAYVNVPWTDEATTLAGHYSPTRNDTIATGSVPIGGTFTVDSNVFDMKGHNAGTVSKTWTITAPDTQSVVKSATLTNNMKYAELAYSAPEIDETWLQAVTGLSSAVATSSYVSIGSLSTSSSTAYVKIV